MSKKIGRRTFLKHGAKVGAGAIVAAQMISKQASSGTGSGVDISVVKGSDYFKNALTAVDELGGMGRFVPKKSKVAILANPQRNNPGAFTSPEVLRAVIEMCQKAGASKINCISWQPLENWESTGLKTIVEKAGVHLVIANRENEDLFKVVPIPQGKELKEARIMKSLYDNDVFISVPVCKDHAGNKFTGTLKNMMGVNSPMSDRAFHRKDWTTNPDSIRYLDQCIADLNLVLKPTLCVVDATEFIITKGPFGPGKIHKPQKVVAGVDRVALDAYCCTLWGLKATDIHMIQAAHEHGLGQINLSKLKVAEKNL